MFPDEKHGDAGDANSISSATPAPSGTSAATLFSSANSDAGDATVAALADDLEYTLTVSQAVERMTAAGRKAPSERSIQRYCIEGRLAAQKIRTVFGSEWLINELSLTKLIESEPIVTGDAGVATSSDIAASATPNATLSNSDRADTPASGDAGVADQTEMATPKGEKRTVAEVLIENARLLAQVEGRDAIIAELKEDRIFLREEVREGRRTRDDVKNIAERMLDTLKTMAIGRSALSGPIQATVIDSESHHG
jgi:hypothetical protein